MHRVSCCGCVNDHHDCYASVQLFHVVVKSQRSKKVF